MKKNIFDTMSSVDSNLSSMISTSNQDIEAEQEESKNRDFESSTIIEEDEGSMNSLLNHIGLAVQRQGG